ncbi:hypothetical protein PAL_GLEAN10021922 [Pteropus alecto]|uniref:Uncharacterized protein n=1 Tax=Pteropus alecto TaxID=9402 RepID=L5KLX4_PTEAL|nr:hypothetical protein PAL_GLEAN10021922 [Pteropus alecto]
MENWVLVLVSCQSAPRQFGERLLLLSEMLFPRLIKEGAPLDHSAKLREVSERLRELVQRRAQLLQVRLRSEPPEMVMQLGDSSSDLRMRKTKRAEKKC